ncbi:LPS-assembly lipoprotein LptE [Aquicella siphonis]|uniref:LPS-assembly lipoprotein LptE n=1 Tax=Aquicella siphonis TaxID=254247 RepID=A0A5E4PH54_9COXI|nr:LPS assembly lipoprotein LptE [Aquicella siphonis]VVC76234.1 LPS-assembly lipoprotein LptE [Aquicella siphonis]
MIKKLLSALLLLCLGFALAGCGFHLQGETRLAPPLHRMYLQTSDPYGQLARNLQQYLKLSKVQLVSSPQEATAILNILHDNTSQELLSVSGTQQTRQYTLKVTVTFEISDAKGRTIISPQTLSESRTMTVQSNQVLGSSNEASLFYQQMRRTLAYAIMKRIASKEITQAIENAFHPDSDQIKP